MCGIAGWFDRNVDFGSHKKTLMAMSESLGRRGPDDSGICVKDGVCLIHRRLAVIDVQNGRQPMTCIQGKRSCTIVYNGEIYNTSELRNELSSYGYSFSTKSDTEVVLASYMCWGGRCVEKLNGIFAFAVYDSGNGSVFLARDRIGVKPLFFYEYDKGMLFASEINCLLQNPLVKPIIIGNDDGNHKVEIAINYDLGEAGPSDNEEVILINGVKSNQDLLRVVSDYDEVMSIPSEGIILSNYHAGLLGCKVGDIIEAYQEKEVAQEV